MTQTPESIGKVLLINVGGEIPPAEMHRYVDDLERIIDQHGKARLLVEMESLPRTEPLTVWESLKFNSEHLSDIERVAVVGMEEWREWYTKFTNPFSPAEIRHFDLSQLQEAWDWLREKE